MKKTKNHLRVDKHRKIKGNLNYMKKYHLMRFKYDIDPKQANIMKYWAIDRIKGYLFVNNITPTEDYINTLKEVDIL